MLAKLYSLLQGVSVMPRYVPKCYACWCAGVCRLARTVPAGMVSETGLSGQKIQGHGGRFQKQTAGESSGVWNTAMAQIQSDQRGIRDQSPANVAAAATGDMRIEARQAVASVIGFSPEVAELWYRS